MTITLAASSCLGGTVWVSESRWGELWTDLDGRLDHGVGGSEMEMMGYGIIPIINRRILPKKKASAHSVLHFSTLRTLTTMMILNYLFDGFIYATNRGHCTLIALGTMFFRNCVI